MASTSTLRPTTDRHESTGAEGVASLETAEMTEKVFEFPKSWRKSFSHWLSANSTTASQSEAALIARGLPPDIPLVTSEEADRELDPTKKRALLKQIPLKGFEKDKRMFINCLEIGTPEKSNEEEMNVVVTHGYGNGIAFYFQNLVPFCQIPKSRIFFIDWLGMGRSGRPSFPHIKSKDVKTRVKDAEGFFLDSFDEWLDKEGIKKMVLVGHSIGAYLSASYTINNPSRVDKLVLISPAGVPDSPFEPQPLPTDQEIEREAERAFQAGQQQVEGTSPKQRPKGLWAYLWEANVSPFSLLRFSSFLGPSLLSTYASHRFALFPSSTQSELFSYLYSISKARGSGEYCLAHLLEPGAYARWPIGRRLTEGGVKVPISFIYGENDWMDEKGGRRVVRRLKELAASGDEDREMQRKRSKVVINKFAGHWVHLENPDGFNDFMRRELRDALVDGGYLDRTAFDKQNVPIVAKQ